MSNRNAISQRLVAVGFGIVLAGIPVIAHHSFSAEYDANKPVHITGKLTGAELVNPHGWLHVDAVDTKGKIVHWAIETGGANALYRRGWRAEDLPVGKVLVVDGYLGKDGSATMNAVSVTFEDGRKLFAGNQGPAGAE
jgi:hypothetical protein